MIKLLAKNVAYLAAVLLLTGNGAVAQAEPAAPAQIKLKLTTVIIAIPEGKQYLQIRNGLCIGKLGVERGLPRHAPPDMQPYIAAFKTEMEAAGFKTVTDDNLFNAEDQPAADYQVAGIITDADITACVSTGSIFEGGLVGDVHGNGSITVDWQVYSPVRKEVVAHVSTTGMTKLDKADRDGMTKLIVGAFDDNLRNLAAADDFKKAMSAKPLAPQDVLRSDQQSAIALAGNKKAAKRPIADTIGSVVTIMTGDGSGSGVLLSTDGYIITDAHVVGEEKELRVRSDGIEKVGEVVRVSKTRDVAIIKTDPRGRPPVPIQLGGVSPAQRVYAIGSPRGKDFQGTVSSGVVSAIRTMDGLNYIQSDVSVSPGSSGGALLTESGALIGLTDLGIQNNGPAGLNFFTPIGDAMDFLNLEQD